MTSPACDDEDGVSFPSMTAGQPMTLPVIVTNTTGSTAYLNAWIDYNNNGVLTDAGEQIASNVNIITGTNGGTINLISACRRMPSPPPPSWAPASASRTCPRPAPPARRRRR
jgi:hypothetical protein